MPKCVICPLLTLPICAGTSDPTLCVPGPATDGRRNQRSLWLSSQAGWPAVVIAGDAPDDSAPFANPLVEELADTVAAPREYRVGKGSGRAKPVLRLGERQR